MPPEWNSFSVEYKYESTIYHIKIMQTETGNGTIISMDGRDQDDMSISLVNDSGEHWVEIKMPAGIVVA